MEKTTAEIIMVCKGQHDFGKFPTLKQAVAAYMSDRCLCPIEAYTDAVSDPIDKSRGLLDGSSISLH